MSTQHYQGSCHCRAVQFEADIDLDAGSGRCNCTICQKSRNWSIIIKPEAFKLLTSQDHLAVYDRGPGQYLFCKTCGIRPFSRGHLEMLGGDFVSVAVGCLDISQKELASVPIHYMNGRDDDWYHVPEYTSHL